MRLPFLILTPACVVLGVAAAVWSGGTVNLFHLLLVFVGAVSAHISVNSLNEYHDFQSGLDFRTERTPFSGGSGTLPAWPEKAGVARSIALISMGVVISIGIYFLSIRGFWLLPLGIAGVITIIAYTRWITSCPFICLIAPGLGFGIFMVMGTDFVLTGSYSWTSFVASLVPFFLVSDLLLLNQFPDVEADRAVGRRHLPIVIGQKASTRVYGLFLVGAYGSIIVGYFCRILPSTGFVALASIALAVPTLRGIIRHAGETAKLIPFMGRNVMITVLTPILLAIGLFVAR
jgi:1,4-dihydroxy-2-naphthoate octaprenyltransferase